MTTVSKEFLRLLRRRGQAAPARKMIAEAFGPEPSPNLAALVTEANAAYLLNRIRFAEDPKEAEAEVAAYVREIADDWCGTPPRIKFPPIPWPVLGLPTVGPLPIEMKKMVLVPADYADAAITYQWVSDELAADAPELAERVTAMAQELVAFATTDIDICVHVHLPV
ncbi:hypothetical protein [Nonomuraea typhae]|uniref:hypothetical protein n=1 Tax=Nonomuraea typhae TaxID=2603600 RepID=UPI0012F89F25|nr:hypothetical protein [Nonomuraea typhae]